jgi:hypothetical protein
MSVPPSPPSQSASLLSSATSLQRNASKSCDDGDCLKQIPGGPVGGGFGGERATHVTLSKRWCSM